MSYATVKLYLVLFTTVSRSKYYFWIIVLFFLDVEVILNKDLHLFIDNVDTLLLNSLDDLYFGKSPLLKNFHK